VVSVARKTARAKNDAKAKFICFEEGITGARVTNPKTVLDPNFNGYFGFRDNDSFYDIHDTSRPTARMVTVGVATPSAAQECRNTRRLQSDVDLADSDAEFEMKPGEAPGSTVLNFPL
jgi:hypothetical protein